MPCLQSRTYPLTKSRLPPPPRRASYSHAKPPLKKATQGNIRHARHTKPSAIAALSGTHTHTAQHSPHQASQTRRASFASSATDPPSPRAECTPISALHLPVSGCRVGRVSALVLRRKRRDRSCAEDRQDRCSGVRLAGSESHLPTYLIAYGVGVQRVHGLS